jgi:hypothetical protein
MRGDNGKRRDTLRNGDSGFDEKVLTRNVPKMPEQRAKVTKRWVRMETRITVSYVEHLLWSIDSLFISLFV